MGTERHVAEKHMSITSSMYRGTEERLQRTLDGGTETGGKSTKNDWHE